MQVRGGGCRVCGGGLGGFDLMARRDRHAFFRLGSRGAGMAARVLLYKVCWQSCRGVFPVDEQASLHACRLPLCSSRLLHALLGVLFHLCEILH